MSQSFKVTTRSYRTFAFLKTVRTDIKYCVLGTSTAAIFLSNDHSLRFTSYTFG